MAAAFTATDAGSAFYREVDRSFVGLEKLQHSAREILELGSGRLRIVAAPVLALSFLPAVIACFADAHPRVAVSLEMRSEHDSTLGVVGTLRRRLRDHHAGCVRRDERGAL